ncbi:MAG: hypothetical protein RLZZ546_323, partial [Bacteroidota bacterium]
MSFQTVTSQAKRLSLVFLFYFLFSTQIFSAVNSVIGGSPIILLPQTSECLDNGFYGHKISFKAGRGLKWKIYESFNLLDSLNMMPFLSGNLGALLLETSISPTQSIYSIYGKYESGKKFVITFIDKHGDYYTVNGGGDNYNNLFIDGKISVCQDATESYSVPPHSEGYSVSVTGGTIMQSNQDSSKVTVKWPAMSGKYELTFKRKNAPCTNISILEIAVGNNSTALACKGKINISADETCTLEVSPKLISASNIENNDAYVVMLFNSDNTPIAGNKITAKSIGKNITAKLIQGCSQNSCWSSIKVEDKSAPKIICKDTIVVNCYDSALMPPIAIDNCDAITKVTLTDSFSTSTSCHKLYSLFINKKYTAKDISGNKSTICNQVLAVKRIPIDSIAFPTDFTHSNGLMCNDYLKDKDGGPSPDVTGYPSYNYMNIYLSHAQICNIYSSYVDTKIGYIGCTEKIMRTWTIVEWRCDSSKIRKHNQLIYIVDHIAPTVVCPKFKTASTNNALCDATIVLDPIKDVKDECSSSFSYHISYGTGHLSTNGGIVTLPSGINKIIYKVSDQCGNYSTCETTINVRDESAPVMACHTRTVVGLTSQGTAHLFPASIDDGSYDFCGLDSMKIRRLDKCSPCTDSFGVGDAVWFNCDDVMKEIMVELKIWNKAGLANSCMTSVIVQDKTPPSIICPPDATISCETTYDINNLKSFGLAIGSDACNFIITEKVKENINQCRVGNLERIFTIKDRQDSVSCTSFIYLIKKESPSNIKWPDDYSVKDSCSIQNLKPENLPVKFSQPIIYSHYCDLYGINYKDSYFSFNDANGSCFKIIRTWTVLDYCKMNEIGYDPITYQQIIKVSNTIDPILLLDLDSEGCTLDDDCDKGRIKLKASATDDCTPLENLEWSYEIDLDYKDDFKADIKKTSIGRNLDASNTYPVGKHRIIIIVSDKCGNQV